ncbi:MAG: hypothetical protein ABUL62_26945 [Myxococcales bacterium]
MSLARPTRCLLPTLSALFLALTVGQTSQAAGSSRASSALQIGVEVVRSCTVDSTATASAATFDAAARAALVHATQGSLAVSCGLSETRVAVQDVRVSLVGPSATMPQLDVEF